MAKNFKELQAKMPREARVRSEEAAKKMISKMERRSDMYISTLSKIIEAMGGELQIIANMPNGRVQIRQFTKIRKGEFESTLQGSDYRCGPRIDSVIDTR